MKKVNIYWELLIGAIVIAPFIYLLIIWNKIPIEVPIHFDAQGNPDGYGTRGNLGLLILFLSIGTYLFLRYIPKIDPKKNFSIFKATYFKLRIILSLFFTVLCFIIIFSALDKALNTSVFYFIFALLFSLMGNYMSNIRPNYFLGVRTPWALENEMNWKKTHFITGRVWFIGGILIGVSVLLLPKDLSAYIFLGSLIPIALFPIIYSFIYYQKNNQN